MTYFQHLKTHSKTLYRSIVIFCGLTLLLTLAGHQITPFFLWAMFSEKVEVQPNQEIISIKINGEPFNYTQELIDANRHIVIGTIGHYYDMKSGSDTDPTRQFFQQKLDGQYATFQPLIEQMTNDSTQYSAFENWLHCYLERSTHQDIQTLEIDIQNWQYQANGQLIYQDSKPLIRYED